MRFTSIPAQCACAPEPNDGMDNGRFQDVRSMFSQLSHARGNLAKGFRMLRLASGLPPPPPLPGRSALTRAPIGALNPSSLPTGCRLLLLPGGCFFCGAAPACPLTAPAPFGVMCCCLAAGCAALLAAAAAAGPTALACGASAGGGGGDDEPLLWRPRLKPPPLSLLVAAGDTAPKGPGDPFANKSPAAALLGSSWDLLLAGSLLAAAAAAVEASH